MAQSEAALAGGGGRGALSSGVLGMTLFLFTEFMLFAGLISAFLILRAQAPVWPPAGQPRLPVAVTGANTIVLILSGFTMARAVGALTKGSAAAVRWLQATAALGLLFLLIQGTEWTRLVSFGLTGHSSVYGATFYALVGIHGIHVAAAVVVLFVNLLRTMGGLYTPAEHVGLSLCRMYWIFVVGVWPVLYLLLYQPWAS